LDNTHELYYRHCSRFLKSFILYILLFIIDVLAYSCKLVPTIWLRTVAISYSCRFVVYLLLYMYNVHSDSRYSSAQLIVCPYIYLNKYSGEKFNLKNKKKKCESGLILTKLLLRKAFPWVSFRWRNFSRLPSANKTVQRSSSKDRDRERVRKKKMKSYIRLSRVYILFLIKAQEKFKLDTTGFEVKGRY